MHHQLLIRYQNGTENRIPITGVTEQGITGLVDGITVSFTPAYLDEHHCWIDHLRQPVHAPYAQHWRNLAASLRIRKTRTGRQS